jgi:hypothetical protein
MMGLVVVTGGLMGKGGHARPADLRVVLDFDALVFGVHLDVRVKYGDLVDDHLAGRE